MRARARQRDKARVALAAAMLWLFAGGTAAAERLVISLSTHRVMINQHFTGVELTLFGTVEPDAASVGRPGGGYTVVATVLGPRESVVTWRKERVLGIWANARSKTFVNAPSYLAVLSNRPVDAIAAPEVLRRFQIGLAHFPFTEEGGTAAATPDDEFRAAFVRLKRQHSLYREQPNALTFLTPNLFRAAITLPANVPVGDYEVDVKLFIEGSLLARETTAFEIIKAGFEQVVATAAYEQPLLYGLATAMLALLTGWLGSVVFRRD
jgi:uncharacterized protein (TIGR02186 family)